MIEDHVSSSTEHCNCGFSTCGSPISGKIPLEYFSAVARREIARLQGCEDTKDFEYSSERTETSHAARCELHIDLLHKFLAVLPHILPSDKEISRAALWHRDLHENNIFVDDQDPTKITSIIDWQNVWAAPLYRKPSNFLLIVLISKKK